MVAKVYLSAYAAKHSGCGIHFSALYAGLVQCFSKQHLGSIDVKDHFPIYRRDIGTEADNRGNIDVFCKGWQNVLDFGS